MDKNYPKKLLNFKELLHPTRLAIMLILRTQLKIPATDLRSFLDIPWGTLDSHLKVLRRHGLVSIGKEFVFDTPRVVVVLEGKGEKRIAEFEELWKKLNEED